MSATRAQSLTITVRLSQQKTSGEDDTQTHSGSASTASFNVRLAGLVQRERKRGEKALRGDKSAGLNTTAGHNQYGPPAPTHPTVRPRPPEQRRCQRRLHEDRTATLTAVAVAARRRRSTPAVLGRHCRQHRRIPSRSRD